MLCGKIRDCRKLSTNQTARKARHSSAKLLNLKKNSAMPKEYEWVAALGLVVTLVWLYLEILRLLSYLRN